ncbi:MAG: OmpA family protein [Planctomycetes bacterium]|nr:OmpA family protein [Planctomycetota bacterium]
MKKVIGLCAASLAIAVMSGCAVSTKDYDGLVKRVEQERAINHGLKSQVVQLETDLAKVEEANVRYREALEKALEVQPTEVVVATAPANTQDVNDEVSKLGQEIRDLVKSKNNSEFAVVHASHAVGIRLDDGIDLLFRPGSRSLTANAKTSLSALAEMLKETLEKHPEYLVRIDGHTDADPIQKAKPNGVVENIDLGYQRANTVRKFLVEAGIDQKKLMVLSAGEWMPIGANKAQNRRVEIWVSTPDGFSFSSPSEASTESVKG